MRLAGANLRPVPETRGGNKRGTRLYFILHIGGISELTRVHDVASRCIEADSWEA